MNKNSNITKINKGKKIKVLLVEDDAIIRIVHGSFLEKLGCTVDIACHGREAMDMIENSYDIIFMDMGLPDIDGTDLVKAFRTNSNIKKHTPIIAITGYSSESSKQDFLAAGIDDVAVKPVFLEQLEKIIQQYSGKCQTSG